MATVVHIIDVGQGNMVLIETSTGNRFFFDCNITDDNKSRVLGYLRKKIGAGSGITAFICSHRDADHIRGITTLHRNFPIGEIWDSDYPGTTTDCDEYLEYMRLRREIGSKVIKRQTRHDYGSTRFRYMSAQDERLPDNPNAQGIVLKVEHRNGTASLASVMLPADSDAETWRYGIMEDYAGSDVSSSLLMGGHHGSISFFDDAADEKSYYVEHMRTIAPGMTLISVGPNNHGHPDKKALELYEKYSSGSDKRNKIARTDEHGTMILTLKDDGGWNLQKNQ